MVCLSCTTLEGGFSLFSIIYIELKWVLLCGRNWPFLFGLFFFWKVNGQTVYIDKFWLDMLAIWKDIDFEREVVEWMFSNCRFLVLSDCPFSRIERKVDVLSFKALTFVLFKSFNCIFKVVVEHFVRFQFQKLFDFCGEHFTLIVNFG